MVMSRSAFGRRGGYFPAAMQGLVSAGWCAVNTWVVLDLVLALIGKLGYHTTGTWLKIVIVVLIMGLQIYLAARGFKSIAKFERYTVPVTFCVLVAMTIVAWTKNNVHWAYAGAHLHGSALLSAETTIMTAIGIGWGFTWFAYASDYSRFVPRAVSRSKVFFASVFGQFLPVVWLGIFGATLATVTQKVDPGALVVSNFGILAIPVLLLVLHGPIATNILNIYSCSLCAQTLDWHLNRRKIALTVGQHRPRVHDLPRLPDQFRQHLGQLAVGTRDVDRPLGGDHLDPLLLVQSTRRSTWTCSMTRRSNSRIPNVRWSAIIAFVVGAFAAWCFEYGEVSWLQGFGATAIGNIDLTWLVGAVVGGGIYLIIGRPSVDPLFSQELHAEPRESRCVDATGHPQRPACTALGPPKRGWSTS